MNGDINTDFHRVRISMVEFLSTYFADASIALSRFNPITGKHESICSVGYNERMLNFLDNSFIENDESMKFLKLQCANYIQWDWMPFNYEEKPAAVNYFIPNGYYGGITQLLYTPSHQYTGALHINIRSNDPIGQDIQHLVARTARMLGNVTDWWQDVASSPIEIAPKDHLFFVSSDGISCRGDDPNTILGSKATLKLLKLIGSSALPHRFYLQDSHGQTWFMTACRRPLAVLIHAAPSLYPYSITSRELEVASKLVAGLQNKEIARALNISERTVSHHVENLMCKLKMHNRSSAAIYCLQNGIVTID